MTTTSGPFIIGLIIILMIIHAIAVTLYLRNKRLTPSSVLDEYDYIQFDVTPTKKIATTE